MHRHYELQQLQCPRREVQVPLVRADQWRAYGLINCTSGREDLEALMLRIVDIFGKPPLLCGVFPLERRLGYRGLPVAYLRCLRPA
jgi:hypothetical protein